MKNSDFLLVAFFVFGFRFQRSDELEEETESNAASFTKPLHKSSGRLFQSHLLFLLLFVLALFLAAFEVAFAGVRFLLLTEAFFAAFFAVLFFEAA